MGAEAAKSRTALAALLSQLRKPLSGSGLWPVTRSAAALCSEAFEKAYLAKLAGRICGASERATELAGLAAELFMFAALTVDDWSDGATFRAGKPAIHSAHGLNKAIFSANCLTEAAHLALRDALASVPEPLRVAFLQSFRTAVLSIQAGQARISSLAGTPVHSLAVVERLARQRCGDLVASAMSAGAYLSGRTDLLPVLTDAGAWLGIALQHRNDIQDFTVAFDQRIKPPLADLLNGQPNLVACLLFQMLPHMKPKERTFLRTLHGRINRQPSKVLTNAEFTTVLDLVDRYGIAPRAARRLGTCVARSRQAVGRFPPLAAFEEFNDYLELVVQP